MESSDVEESSSENEHTNGIDFSWISWKRRLSGIWEESEEEREPDISPFTESEKRMLRTFSTTGRRRINGHLENVGSMSPFRRIRTIKRKKSTKSKDRPKSEVTFTIILNDSVVRKKVRKNRRRAIRQK